MLPFPMAFIRKTCVGGKKVVLVRTLWYLCVDNDQFWQIAKNLDFMFIFWNETKNGTLLKPERTQNPERAQNVLQLRSGFSTERTFFNPHSKKVRSGFSTERNF